MRNWTNPVDGEIVFLQGGLGETAQAFSHIANRRTIEAHTIVELTHGKTLVAEIGDSWELAPRHQTSVPPNQNQQSFVSENRAAEKKPGNPVLQRL